MTSYTTSDDYAEDTETPVTLGEVQKLLRQHSAEFVREENSIRAFDGCEWTDVTSFSRAELLGWLGY